MLCKKLIEIWQERDEAGEMRETRRVLFFDKENKAARALTSWNQGSYGFIRNQKFEEPISLDSELAFIQSLPKTSLFKSYELEDYLYQD